MRSQLPIKTENTREPKANSPIRQKIKKLQL